MTKIVTILILVACLYVLYVPGTTPEKKIVSTLGEINIFNFENVLIDMVFKFNAATRMD